MAPVPLEVSPSAFGIVLLSFAAFTSMIATFIACGCCGEKGKKDENKAVDDDRKQSTMDKSAKKKSVEKSKISEAKPDIGKKDLDLKSKRAIDVKSSKVQEGALGQPPPADVGLQFALPAFTVVQSAKERDKEFCDTTIDLQDRHDFKPTMVAAPIESQRKEEKSSRGKAAASVSPAIATKFAKTAMPAASKATGTVMANATTAPDLARTALEPTTFASEKADAAKSTKAPAAKNGGEAAAGEVKTKYLSQKGPAKTKYFDEATKEQLKAKSKYDYVGEPSKNGARTKYFGGDTQGEAKEAAKDLGKQEQGTRYVKDTGAQSQAPDLKVHMKSLAPQPGKKGAQSVFIGGS